jgi:hypothetical protein
MKTVITKFIQLTLFAAIILAGTVAAKTDGPNRLAKNNSSIKNIHKVTVAGNVNLIIIQDVNEHVEVLNQYYPTDALVHEKDGSLHITSYNRDRLRVILHVKQLSSLAVKDKASVKTFGNFYLPDLNITLTDQSSAAIHAHTVSLTTHVSGDARLNLSGSTEDHFVKVRNDAALNTSEFTAKNTDINMEKEDEEKYKKHEEVEMKALLHYYDVAMEQR